MLIKSKNSISQLKEFEAHRRKNDPFFLTRRQLFEKGLRVASYSMLAPSLLSVLLSRDAKAVVTPKKFCTMDMSGGAGFGPEVIFVKRDGSFLASYDTLGNPTTPSAGTTASNTYGAWLWTNGTLYTSLQANLVPAAVGNLKICVIMQGNNQDDSGANQTLITSQAALLANQILPGFRIRGGLSNNHSTSGGNSKDILDLAGYSPSVTNSLQSVQDLLTVAQGPLADLATRAPNGPGSILSLASSLTHSGGPILGGKGAGSSFVNAIAQSISDNQSALANPISLDPRTDAVFQQSYSITSGSAANNADVIEAANIKALTDGYSPSVCILDTGFDYHDNTNGWKTNQHPRMINRTIKILNSCALKGQSVMIHWNTDGGIQFAAGTENARGDSNERHSSVVFVLSMNGDPAPQRFYLGSFTDGQTAESNETSQGQINMLAEDPTYEGYAVLATLLGFNGITDVSPWAPTSLNPSDMESWNLFLP